MSPGKKIEIETPAEEADEASAGTLSPSPELEEALREAAEALDDRGAAYEPPSEAQAAENSSAAAEDSSAAAEDSSAAAEDSSAAGEDSSAAAEGGEDLALELKQTQDRFIRLQADFENFRRRALKEKTEAHQYGHQNLVKDLLSTVDNLDRAIDHASSSGSGDLESLLQGVELVRRELLGALAKNGVTRIEAVGQNFDPALHEAMAQSPDGSVAPNTIVEELQKGYKLRDRLLRPSRVIVARAPDDASGASQAGEPGEAGD